MMTSIQFDVQFSRFAKEIQGITAEWMLAAEFVAIEFSAPQPAPHKFFGPCIVLAKCSGLLDCHGVNLGKANETESQFFTLALTLTLSPRERVLPTAVVGNKKDCRHTQT